MKLKNIKSPKCTSLKLESLIKKINSLLYFIEGQNLLHP